MPTKLVIVESPAKGRKIAGYLGSEFVVDASIGHIRDLPQPSELPAEMKKGSFGKFAVDVENGFEPYYVVYPDKKKKVTELKKLLKDADELYLATDDDREGEAIAWHLIQVLKPKVPVKRMVFHEITQAAITRALENSRELNTDLVDAQETRRILDRLYGYEVSPVLWRKIRQGLSAGRVQSVATRMVVERERERMAFCAAGYFDVTGSFAPTTGPDAGTAITARLVALGSDRVATGRDFDDTGRLKVRTGVIHLGERTAAEEVVAGLDGAQFQVRSLETKPYSRKPAAPFTTSTLQQEASRKLRMNARATMRTAQSLYENGYITYMRTDSPALSSEAIAAARKQATELYGADSVPGAPRLYQAKSAGAQEAHEAIRPAGNNFRAPEQLRGELNDDQYKLYDLIWKRTVASQMADAKGSTASVRLGTMLAPGAGQFAGRDAVFAASGTVITFRGFLAAYEESVDEAATSTKGRTDVRLPQMLEGDPLAADAITAESHTTNPPARYTEASLVRALEELEIGRPSTYASTMSTIQDRGYVRTAGQALIPTWLAFAVTKLMEEKFEALVNYQFTAEMERDLDDIAAGKRSRRQWLQEFYFGGGGGDDIDSAQTIPGGLKALVEGFGDIDPVAVNSVDLGEGLRLRVGRYGPYVEDLAAAVPDGANPPRASVPDDLAPDELTPAKARELLAAGGDEGRTLGTHPSSGVPIVAKNGRFGPFVTEVLPAPDETQFEGMTAAAKKRALAALPKPRTASLFKDMALESVTLDDALKLFTLPRVVGVDPTSGEEITAQNGRYGPYLKKGTDSRTLASESQLLTITLDEALAIYAEPKRRGAGGTATPPLRELGLDPTSEKPIVIKDGRFGAYVTDGVTNRTLPKEFTPETITPEQAIELLAAKRAAGPVKRKAPAARKTTAKKATTRKPPAKK